MITINDIIKVCKGTYNGKDLDTECKKFCTDTRKINKDDVYIGIKGEKIDGNTLYKEALEKGAKLCILKTSTIIERQYKDKVIFVEDTIEALQKIAKFKREQYNIPVIAITGSVGKTSVKDMIYAVLSKKYNVLCSKGNMNTQIGVPQTILELDNHNAMILEMGMNHPGEIHRLSMTAEPTIGVITNIGTAHIGNLGSRENILKAKLEILDGMKDGYLVINNDNDLLTTIDYEKLITVGINTFSDYLAEDISVEAFESTFKVEDNYMTIPFGSEAYIRNALLAYAVGRKLGIDKLQIEDALENIELTPHRMEVIKLKDKTLIDESYNASLDSVKNAAELLNKVNNRKVFIFADMLELDTYGQKIHEEVGHIFLENKIDLLITVGNLTKYTHEVFKQKNPNCYHFENNAELIKEIDNLLKEDDMILIKGSLFMNLIEVVEYLKKSSQ